MRTGNKKGKGWLPGMRPKQAAQESAFFVRWVALPAANNNNSGHPVPPQSQTGVRPGEVSVVFFSEKKNYRGEFCCLQISSVGLSCSAVLFIAKINSNFGIGGEGKNVIRWPIGRSMKRKIGSLFHKIALCF